MCDHTVALDSNRRVMGGLTGMGTKKKGVGVIMYFLLLS